MAKKKRPNIAVGDILVMRDGDVCRVRYLETDYTVVTWIDKDEDGNLWDLNENDIESILTPTAETVFTFNVAHGLHQRLNRFKNL